MDKKTKEILKKLLIKIVIIIGILIVFQQIIIKLNGVQAATDYSEKQRVYLSDIPYNSNKLEEKSTVGWGSITMNKNLDSSKNNGLISLIVDNKPKTFLKGISAHANSQVIFDVEDLVEQGFTRFSTYYGVDAGRGSTGVAVAFKITYKTDVNTPWKTEGALENTGCHYKGNTPAGFIEIDLTGKKFIKLEAYVRGENTAAHACYGSPQVYKPGFTEESAKADFIKTVEEYDSIIKERSKANNFKITNDYELTLLQRDLVNTVGYDLLQEYVALDSDNLDVVRWLMTDINNLQPFMMGGKPEGGSYFKVFDILSNLYKQRGDDLKDTTEITTTRGKSTLAEMYKTMMFSISLTHSGSVYFWVNGSNHSDPIERYDIYKRLYHGKVVADDRTTKGIGNDLIEKNKFASLHVEEMRWVMNTIIDNEEIEWLNWYAREVKNGAVGPYSYQIYTFGYNYNRDQYYSQENREKWTQKYNLSTDRWNITYGQKGNPKIWIVFEEGSVCGGLSKNGACVWGAFKGLPNTCVSQPAHCAYLYYNQDADGNGIWGLGNDVGGWHQTGRTEHLNVRMPLEWGNEEYIDFNKDWLGMGTYVLLSQGALNNYEKYTKSKELLMLADVYKNDNDPETLEKIYKNSIEELPINIDAWYGLIKLYRQDKTKSDEDYYKLAQGIFKELKYYPLPMYHLAREVQKDLKTAEYQFQFILDETKTLNEANVVKDNAVDEKGKKLTLQGPAVRQEATHLLGQTDSRLATFSFDGNNAGAIKLGKRFEGSDVAWDYSLDGKQTWTQADDYEAGAHIQKLTDAQINSITSTNDIYVHIIGAGYEEENCYKIDILDNVISEGTYYGNDLENRVIGVNSSFEWRNSENDPWTSYSAGSPDLTGNKTVQIRQVANGVNLASNVLTFTFTEDNQPDTRKYIPVSHLSIHTVSTQATNNQGAATFAIDGNYNTRWHSAWNGTDTERFIVIKLDKSVALSAVEFVPAGGGNGRIVDGTVYGSMDGETWEELAKLTGQTYPKQAETNELAKEYTKSFEIENPKEVQYVKIVANKTNGNWFTARAFNLYQDLTKNPHPTAGIAYSTNESTNGVVVARLINPSTEITITNNNGSDTFVFTENGEFTFEFVDAKGKKGTVLAKVDWIDKDVPTADVEYELDTNEKLVISLEGISEDVYLLDKNNKKINYIEVSNGKVTNIFYLDSSGNTNKEVEVDENGKITRIIYKNTISDEEVRNVSTYATTIANGVIVEGGEEYLDSEGNPVEVSNTAKEKLRVLQQSISNPLEYTFDKSGDYEFKMLDKASNIAYKSIKVDYIENDTTILASDITYSATKLTNKDVIATINPYIIDTSGKHTAVEVTSEDGTTHTFTENGEFTFTYKNASDTENWEVKQHKAKVNWIDKVAPTARAEYSTPENLKGAVIATLVDESEEIIVTNNGISKEYTFMENGTFIFKFQDKAGNEGTATAIVDWIVKDSTITSNVYTVEKENILVPISTTKKDKGITVKEFAGNITSEEECVILDKEGNTVSEEDIIKTGMKVKAGDKAEYTIILIGDIDRDGKITVNDLAKLKLHYIKYELLEGVALKAADTDKDKNFTINDIAKMKLVLIGSMDM